MNALHRYTSAATVALALASASPHATLRADEPGSATDPAATAPVVDAVRALGAAIVADDRASARRSLAPDFHGVGFNAVTVDRATYLDVHFTDDNEFTRFEPTETRVRFPSADVALLFGTMLVEIAGREGTDRNVFTTVLERRDGRWLPVAFQETRAAGPGASGE